MEKFLRSLYKEHVRSRRADLILNAKQHSTSLRKLELSDKVVGQFYDAHYKNSFYGFLSEIKTIIYSDNAFEFIKKHFAEDWDLCAYLKLLTDKKIIEVSRDGKVKLLKKQIEKVIPRPQNTQHIKKTVEAKLKVKVKDSEPVINLFKKFKDFQVKGQLDQMPISVDSAYYVVEKILSKLPLNKKFLFVGDDDFISVILTLADENIECLVVDADKQLLDCIDFFAKKFKLKIKTRQIDLSKQKSLGEKFVGFLANPVYTEAGVKEFIKFGVNQLSKDGGFVFLEVGDESIGNRFLFLQEFLSKNNLIVNELLTNKIYYPHILLYEEDREILKRLSNFIDEKAVKKSPKLGAALYVLEYLGKRPKQLNFKKPFYAYL